MTTVPFWKAAAERAVRTIAQTLISLWVVGGTMLDAFHLDWGKSLGVAAGAGLLSLLTSMVAGAAGNGPSFGPEVPVTPATPVAPVPPTH